MKQRSSKWLAVLLSLVMVFQMVPMVYAEDADGDSVPDGLWTDDQYISGITGFSTEEDNQAVAGTSENPYLISSAEELAYLAKMVNAGTTYSGQYFQIADSVETIDLSAHEWVAIGTGSGTNSTFYGTFDGNGKSITGLTITDATTTYQGLFGYVYGATIKDLSVSGTITSTMSYVGGIVGYLSNSSILSGCSFSGSVTSITSTTYEYIGGLVGQSLKSTISNCYNTATVNGGKYVGGVVGSSNSDTIQNCYNTGAVTGTDSYVGGVAGRIADGQGSTTELQYCYNTAQVQGGSRTGGIVGYVYHSTYYGGCMVANCVSL